MYVVHPIHHNYSISNHVHEVWTVWNSSKLDEELSQTSVCYYKYGIKGKSIGSHIILMLPYPFCKLLHFYNNRFFVLKLFYSLVRIQKRYRLYCDPGPMVQVMDIVEMKILCLEISCLCWHNKLSWAR